MTAPDVTTPRAEQPGDATNTSRREEADSTNDIGSGQAGDSVEQSDIRLYFKAVFGEDRGLLTFALGMNPGRDPKSGKYRHGYWSERRGHKLVLHWPEQAEDVYAAVELVGAQGDLYVCPYLRRNLARVKGDAVILRLLHTDVDDGLDLEVARELGAFVVGSGTSGNGHVYVPLSRPVTLVQHKALCKGLIARLGGDKGKHSDNDLLRPVGAYNLKPTVFDNKPPVRITWLVKP
jgi:hypothetical protein